MITIEIPTNELFGIPVPSELAGLVRGVATSNEDSNPGMGVSVPYHGQDIEVTLYIYDFGLSDIPDNSMSPLVRDHFDLITHDALLLAHQMGNKLELVSRYGTGNPDVGVQFLCAKFVGANDRGPFMSFSYLTVKAGYFVKLRMTCRLLPEPAEVLARSVADTYAALLWKEER